MAIWGELINVLLAVVGPTERWYFDAAGRVTRYRSVQPGGVSAGLPMGVNSPGFAGANGPAYDIYYEYDEAGNRTQMGFLGGGVTYFTYYEYDARNLLSALTDPLGQTVYYERDELGREIAKRLPNGVTTYHNYDVAGQVESILHVGPAGVLQSLYYTYDADGQRTKIEREDGTRIYFGYDAAHRLTGEDWLDPSDTHIYGFAYEYDAADNRLRKTFNGEVTYYDYNNLNQLTTERVLGGDTTYYTWTADGAMETKHEGAGWTYYTWDVDESLKKIEAPNVTLENKYNSRMQRVWRSEDGEAEWLVYDAQKLVAEATAGGLERYYLSEGGSVYSPLVSQLGSQHWFLFDALGTTLGLTDGGGGLSDAFKYEAFGTSLGRTGATETPYQYVGGYGYFREAAVGLEQVWWRCLHASSGFWLSNDPLGRSGNYGYVDGMPTVFTDPRGLAAWLRDAWWDVTHAGAILRELPQADVEVWESGYFNCFLRCKVAFGNTGIMKRLIDSVTGAPPVGYAPPDPWGDVASLVPDKSMDLLERYYRYRQSYIGRRLANMWDLPTPTWEGIVPELKTAEGYAKSMGDVLGAAGSVADIAETYLCWRKCKCLLQD